MPKIVFTATPKLPADWQHLPFVKGYVADLSRDQCDRWINRGVARYLPDPASAVVSVESLAEPEPEPETEGEFDPLTAGLDAVRAFLAERGAKPHHKAGEAKLRDMALDVLTASA
jgi:hypothetical protein